MNKQKLLAGFRKLDDLIPYARNSKTHNEEHVAKLAASIVEFGWTFPILADEKGIVAGHGRALAARKLYDQGKTLYLPGGEAIPDGQVPVIDCTGWNDAKRRSYVIADNKLPDATGAWDFEMLAVELDGLRDDGVNLSLLGFSEKELADLIGSPDDPPEPVIPNDESRHLLMIECASENELEKLFEEMRERGLECKILS